MSKRLACLQVAGSASVADGSGPLHGDPSVNFESSSVHLGERLVLISWRKFGAHFAKLRSHIPLTDARRHEVCLIVAVAVLNEQFSSIGTFLQRAALIVGIGRAVSWGSSVGLWRLH